MFSGSTNRRASGSATSTTRPYDAAIRQALDGGGNALMGGGATVGQNEQGKHADGVLAREREDEGAS